MKVPKGYKLCQLFTEINGNNVNHGFALIKDSRFKDYIEYKDEEIEEHCIEFLTNFTESSCGFTEVEDERTMEKLKPEEIEYTFD